MIDDDYLEALGRNAELLTKLIWFLCAVLVFRYYWELMVSETDRERLKNLWNIDPRRDDEPSPSDVTAVLRAAEDITKEAGRA